MSANCDASLAASSEMSSEALPGASPKMSLKPVPRKGSWRRSRVVPHLIARRGPILRRLDPRARWYGNAGLTEGLGHRSPPAVQATNFLWAGRGHEQPENPV